jgi:hypothetical protein
MDVVAKQVAPQEISRMAMEYYRILGTLGNQIEVTRDFIAAHSAYKVRAVIPVWNSFFGIGVQLAQAILGTKEIPDGQQKNLELTVRLFMASRRQPNKPVEWFDKNYKRLNFLHSAASLWPDKKEGESEQRFTHGPFTVHNTMGLAGKDLEGVKDAITKAVILIKGLNIPGIEKVLYGDVMVVGKLNKGTVAAFYYINEDVVYVRPFKNAGFDELHSFIHELGHRYITKFIEKPTWLEWRRYHAMMQYQDTPGGKVKMPEVGEPFPFDVGRQGNRPIIQKIVGLKYYVDDTHSMEWSKIKKILETEAKYPTPYSAKSEDEHFCEALAHRAMGKLKEPNLSAFKFVIEEGNAGWDAVKLSTQRVAVRYMQATDDTWAGDEIFSDKEVTKRIHDFLQMLIVEGQAVSKAVMDQRKWAVKHVREGDKLTDAQVLASALKIVEAQWGDDAMTKPLARLIAFGDYVW